MRIKHWLASGTPMPLKALYDFHSNQTYPTYWLKQVISSTCKAQAS